jgi:hypothetical protein
LQVPSHAAAGAVNEVVALRHAAARAKHTNKAFNIWVLLDRLINPQI